MLVRREGATRGGRTAAFMWSNGLEASAVLWRLHRDGSYLLCLLAPQRGG
ncbi:hypothetical protein [Dictyobacter vulcani]|nr:hypothetical protein [Dictyobacter vulcani]